MKGNGIIDIMYLNKKREKKKKIMCPILGKVNIQKTLIGLR